MFNIHDAGIMLASATTQENRLLARNGLTQRIASRESAHAGA
jgi:hypothetical protein